MKTTSQEFEKLQNSTKEFLEPFVNKMQKPVEWLSLLFNCFNKKKEVATIENEVSKALSVTDSIELYNEMGKEASIEISRISMELAHKQRMLKNESFGVPAKYINPPYRNLTNQSVQERIHARPRKRWNVVMKHLRNRYSREYLKLMRKHSAGNRWLMDANGQRVIEYTIIDCPDND